MIKINEIFYSIQGETSRAGLRTVFVRTTGCHHRCHYCDSKHSYNEGHEMSVEDILSEVKSYDTQTVCITGGEPLLQKEVLSLMTLLCDGGFNVSLETSGDLSCKNVDPRVLKIIDIKTPDSGAKKTVHLENLSLDVVNIEFKFVICTEEDFFWAENFIAKHALSDSYPVLYSPSFHEIEPIWLAKKILSEKSKARLQLQLHKYIWSPDKRRV